LIGEKFVQKVAQNADRIGSITGLLTILSAVVDQIIDEVLEEDRQPTVMELSELFAKTKQKFFGACLQALIEQKYAGLLEQQYAPCPKCAKMWLPANKR